MNEELIKSKIEFDILAALAEKGEGLSNVQLSEQTGYSVEAIETATSELTDKGLLADGNISPKGLGALEPYRAKRAVFIAAGFGSRLVPITLNTPKPLVRVNGQRIIDGLLDAVIAAGIEEIVVVRGYLGEQFDQLLYKYPMIKFIDNTIYNEANNISSAVYARELLQNAYVFEADLLISNPKIIKKYHYSSDFLGIKVDSSDDWCFKTEDGIITEQMVGGKDCYQMVGISYWNAEDGKKLSSDLEATFKEEEGRQLYWEQVPLKIHKDKYKVAIRECRAEDIVEIDTFAELKAIDKSYDV